MIFASLTIPSIRKYVCAHVYCSRAKRKRFHRKSGFQMFSVSFPVAILVHQHGDSIQSSVKLRETIRQITQKRCAAQT